MQLATKGASVLGSEAATSKGSKDNVEGEMSSNLSKATNDKTALIAQFYYTAMERWSKLIFLFVRDMWIRLTAVCIFETKVKILKDQDSWNENDCLISQMIPWKRAMYHTNG